jgi:hypothetical protein
MSLRLGPLTDTQRSRLLGLADTLDNAEYEQDTGKLRTARGFCCLGVQCDLAIKAGITDKVWMMMPDEEEMEDERKFYGFGIQFSGEMHEPATTLPPADILEAYGMSGGVANMLAGLNDAGVSFHAIAIVIREMVNDADIQEARHGH